MYYVTTLYNTVYRIRRYTFGVI